MADGSGDHVTAALEIAAVSGNDADEEQRGSERPQAEGETGLRSQLFHERGNGDHDRGSDTAEDEEDAHSNAEDLMYFAIVGACVCGSDHTAHRDGETCR